MSLQTPNFNFSTPDNGNNFIINHEQSDQYIVGDSVKLDDNQVFVFPTGEFTLGKRSSSPRSKSPRYKKH